MIVAAQYSHKDGLNVITQRYPHLLAELKDIIEAINALESRKLNQESLQAKRALYNPTLFNEAFHQEMHFKGWGGVMLHPLDDSEIQSNTEGAFRLMDFVKDGLGVEVVFNGPSSMICSVCAKMTIFHNLGHIDCGIEIVPVKALSLKMSSGVSYFEQFVWDLRQRGVADIDIPVLILGIDV